ncbi:MAG: type II toxin-antitoxin system Phd/YefM family antitoxin [Deinococcota bacterium]
MKLSITEFERDVRKYLQQSQHDDITITDHNQAVAVILSVQKYALLQQRHQASTQTLADALATLGRVDFEWELPEREPWSS